MPTAATLWENADTLEKLEAQAAGRVSAGLAKDLERLGRLLLAEWARGGADPSPAFIKALQDSLAAGIGRLKPGPVVGILDAAISDALEMGVQLGLSEVDGEKAEKPRRPRPDRQTRQAVESATKKVREHLAAGRAEMAKARTLGEFTAALARARMAQVTLERTARWAVNRAASTGAVAVVKANGGRKLWVAERNGCVSCLAYAGKLAEPDEDFPGGLSFGDRPVSTDPLPHPPLHPNCRCRITVWLGSKEGVGPAELPAVLEREAKRSILRGDALPTESEAVRVAAARNLLQAGSGLPKSVEARARKAVKAGGFS